MNSKFKRTAFIWNKKNFFNIINVFNVTFDQFDVSLLNKIINFWKNPDPKLLNGSIFYKCLAVPSFRWP